MIKRLLRLIFIATLFLPLCFSCKGKSHNAEDLKVVTEWIGKEFKFPDKMLCATGTVDDLKSYSNIIVSYYDSVGCTGCKMKMPYWVDFMNSVDSTGTKVKLILIATGNGDYIKSLVKKFDFPHTIILDSDNKFGKLNNLPDKIRYQTFLLDDNNRILSVGNPVLNNEIRNLYMSVISNDIGDIDCDEKLYEFNVGQLKSGELISKIFRVHNNSNSETLKIRKTLTSCDCINSSLSSSSILPKSDTNLKIDFKDTTKGEFYRSVSVWFDNERQYITIEIQGTII